MRLPRPLQRNWRNYKSSWLTSRPSMQKLKRSSRTFDLNSRNMSQWCNWFTFIFFLKSQMKLTTRSRHLLNFGINFPTGRNWLVSRPEFKNSSGKSMLPNSMLHSKSAILLTNSWGEPGSPFLAVLSNSDFLLVNLTSVSVDAYTITWKNSYSTSSSCVERTWCQFYGTLWESWSQTMPAFAGNLHDRMRKIS